MHRQRLGSLLAVLALVLVLAACQGGAGSASPAASRSGPPAHAARPAVATLAAGCSPCQLTAGAYRLGPGTFLPGLEVTVPAGWSSGENTPGDLNLVPPGQPNDALTFSLDMTAVKSTGAGHGTTILKHVGTTPRALVAWLTHNRDFLIVSKPASATVGQGITMTSLVVGVSRSANYGDPACPANPRCADLFTNSYFGGQSFGIGGNEQVRLYLGRIKIGGSPHTIMVTLDAVNHAALQRLENAAAPIIASVRLPPGAVPG